jgi:putative nucleotidyltransferase with HDIG domain
MAEEHVVNSVEDKEPKEHKELQLLLDSTYPLLQKFREACPGTYKHSQAISSIIEGVALSLGLNVLKMKVMAHYHDIGKTFSPKCFTENQIDEDNPHDKLSPMVSYTIITRHVSDSVAILINDRNFPRDIIEAISQHHGTSVLKYFFDKSGTDIEDAFRYKTTKPTCIESAVLMICDQIEATSRSFMQSNKFDAQLVIDKTINSLIDDGQLDDVVMRLGDLKKIKESLKKEIEGSYQKRVDYDKAKEKAKETKVD